MNDTTMIDVTAEEIGTELVPHQPQSNLFRTDDPVEVIEKATRVATALKDVIVQRHLAKNIQGRDHVLVEGWTTCGAMIGVVPVVTWSRRVEPQTEYTVTVKQKDGRTSSYQVKGYDWEARVEARTLDGRVIGAAEATCSRAEHTWAKRDDYALRSMAQTRATSKALRGPLGFIVTLAGYAATPAEEMPAQDVPPAGEPATTPRRLSAANRAKVVAAITEAGQNDKLIFAAVGVTTADELTADHARQIRALLDAA